MKVITYCKQNTVKYFNGCMVQVMRTHTITLKQQQER